MKKSLFTLALLGLLIGSAAADDMEDFRILIGKNTGYYYCVENNEAVRLSMSSDRFLVTDQLTFDFQSGRISRSTRGRNNIFYDQGHFYRNRVRFDIEGDAVLSFEYLSNQYKAAPCTTEEELIRFMEEQTVQQFERAAGTYYDKAAGRTFSLSRAGDAIELVVHSDAGETVADRLEISTTRQAKGSSYSLFWYDNGITFTVNDGSEEYSYRPPVKFETAAPVPAEEVRSVELYRDFYTFGEDRRKLRITDDAAIVTHGSEWPGDDFGYDLYTSDFSICMDEYGYKRVDAGDAHFLLIDGARQSIAFRYRGDSLREDAEAVAAVFKTYPGTWTTDHYCGGYYNINGGHFENVTASSTLTDRFYTYVPEGVMTVFNPYENTRYWVKDNLPWVEGKEDDGEGDSIEFDIIPTDWRAVVAIDLRILNGYVDPLRPYLFYENNRMKRALVETDSGLSVEVSFNDAVEFTSVTVPKETRHVKLTILEVYRGTKYRDTCITAFDMHYDLWDK